MTDFAILTYLSHKESTLGDRIESSYICKPVSCKIFLATSSSKNTYKSTKNTFSENSFEIKHNIKNVPTQVDKSIVVGFVLHADWSSCYLYLNKSQVITICSSQNIYDLVFIGLVNNLFDHRNLAVFYRFI